MNPLIINEGDFTKLNEYYDMYENFEKLNLENVVVRHMILADNKFHDIKGKIPNGLYEKLVNRKKRAIDEDNGIRERYVRKLCEIKDEEHFKEIMKNLSTHLRKKRRNILIMGGNYEDIYREVEQAIVKVMTFGPSEHINEYDQAVKVEYHTDPSTAPPPSINIESEFMTIEGTNITLNSE